MGLEVARIIRRAEVSSLGHSLLASLGCEEAVTTNYDRLYEHAVAAQRGADRVATILPWEPPQLGRQWILKMHGDVGAPASIVLTRQQFVGYDQETRPAGALLQALLLTRHVLFVGASLNDDNVVRLAYEVNRFRTQYGLEAPVGTLLDVNDDTVRERLWQGQLDWVSVPGSTTQDRTRMLEVFLDAVAAHAASDSSWLLDERFGALHREGSEIVVAGRALYRQLSEWAGEWQPLADALAAFGAATGYDYDELADSRRWRGSVPRG